MEDSLGSRMKDLYEIPYRLQLPKRTYTIIRLDGKAFHTLTRSCEKPYDTGFMNVMDDTTVALCECIQGVKFAYTQSDEISLLLTDFDNENTAAWFDNCGQKMASVSASIATAAFNKVWMPTGKHHGLFDSRVFVIPDPIEVYNYFVWRQNDASRNGVQMLGQHYFSTKTLNGKSCEWIIDNLKKEHEVIWEHEPMDFRLGRLHEKCQVKKDVEFNHKRTGELCRIYGATRHEWKKSALPLFTSEPVWLKSRIPKIP